MLNVNSLFNVTPLKMSSLVSLDGDWLYKSLRFFCYKKLTIKPHQGYLLANAVVLLLLHMCLLLYKRQSRVAPPQQQLRVFLYEYELYLSCPYLAISLSGGASFYLLYLLLASC